MTLFGSPFLGGGLFTLIAGVSILLNEGLEGLFLIFFSLPFLGVGGMMVLGGLYSIGMRIGVIKPKDPSATPRDGSIGPESIQIEHPESNYSGVYERQSNIINGKDWYRKIGGTQRLYFYNRNQGGMKGWSLDDRIDNGAKDWFNGGWIDTGVPNDIPFGTNSWNDTEGEIVIQEVKQQGDLVDIFKGKLKLSIEQDSYPPLHPIPEDMETPRTEDDYENQNKSARFGLDFRAGTGNLFSILVIVSAALFFLPDFDLDGFGVGDYGEEMPDTWCDGTNHYPVTVPITMESAMVDPVDDSGSGRYIEMDNRNTNSDSIMELAINGGVCNYQYRVGDAESFQFTYQLDNVTNIDGVSILLMDHPLGLTNGYSGILIETSIDNGSNWEDQYFSPFMFGEYERRASFEQMHENFSYNEWYRHQFDKTVSNVTHVRLVTFVADQSEDSAVSFSAIRIDAEGDYDYPDYRLCSGTWDNLFVNSTSAMIEWPVYGLDGSCESDSRF